MENNNYNYILFDIYNNEFYDKNNNLIENFSFNNTCLDYKKESYTNFDSIRINNIFKIWKYSINTYFLNKKRKRKHSLYEIHYNSLLNYKNYKQKKLIELKIPNDLLILINQTIIKDEKIRLKFLFNCSINNLQNIQNKYNCIIIFLFNNNIYILYDKMFKIEKENNYSLIEINDKEKIFDEIKSGISTIKKPKLKKKQKKTQKNMEGINDLKEDLEINTNEDINTSEENYLNEIKKKIIVIQYEELFSNKYDKNCFCYFLLSRYSLEKLRD